MAAGETAPDHVADPHDAVIRQLLDKARQSSQAGDIAQALCYAREALQQRNDCSTIHALLGQLYEQQGDAAASRYHFQAALNVATCDADGELLPLEPEPARQPQAAGVMLLVLIGCIVISGLAALFTFHPGRDSADLGSVQLLPRAAHSDSPRWTWRVPAAMPNPPAPDGPAVGLTPGPPAGTDARPPVTPAANVTENPGTADGDGSIVLGPSARGRDSRSLSGRPSLEKADQAFFRGEFDMAVTQYEAILPTLEQPDPRIYRDLAWCYQQLGNSGKAADYLMRATEGYRSLLAADAGNAAAQQGLASCTAALHTLMTTRDRDDASAP